MSSSTQVDDPIAMSNTAELEGEALENTHAPAEEVTATENQVITVPEMEENKKKAVKERKATTPRAKKPKTPAHPPYFQMIKEAITALKEKGGSSPYAIAKFMEQNEKAVLPGNFRKILGPQLKNSVAKGRLIKIKGSFKLSDVATSTKTRAARANAGDKSKKEGSKRRKPKSREVSKIDNPPVQTLASFPTRGRRSKRPGMGAKPKQLKSIKSPPAKKAK